MYYDDPIYGSVQIEEPVLKSLITSGAMQRLKGVLQHGISGLIGITAPCTRFEHSVGVMLLVRRLGGSLEEQIAALLHDVSHTAFSHVIDYVYHDHNQQTYHEEIKQRFMRQTDLPEILEAHGYDWRSFVDETQFSLLEQPAPRLCADRVDYFLRDSLKLNLANAVDVDASLAHLAVHDGRIVMGEVAAAQWLAYTYIAADKASWANFREVGLYELTAQAIRRALQIGVVQETDFWATDEELWQQLHDTNDTEVQETLQLVHPETEFVWDEDRPTFVVSTKLRSIDPDVVLDDNEVAPLSVVDRAFAAYRRAYHEQRGGLWPMRVVASDLGNDQRST